jgi:hypothetical protein
MHRPQQERGWNRTSLASTLTSALILLFLMAALVLLGKGLYPSNLPAATDPDFIDNIFDNRAVIWAARLLLVSAAFVLAVGGIFIVVSTVMRMKNGEWLRRAGPFEISEVSVEDMQGQIEFWRQKALARRSEAEDTQRLLDRSDRLIEYLFDRLGGSR